MRYFLLFQDILCDILDSGTIKKRQAVSPSPKRPNSLITQKSSKEEISKKEGEYYERFRNALSDINDTKYHYIYFVSIYQSYKKITARPGKVIFLYAI